MPTRRVGLQQCVHSFFSIRENPCSPFQPCSISTKQLDDTVHSHKSIYFLCASARDHFFNQKSSASDFFDIDHRLTTVEFWSAPAWRSFLSQPALSNLLLPERKGKRCQGTALHKPTTCCHSFDSCHSWFVDSLIPTSEPFHIAHADSENRPTAMRSLFLFDP